ncbi:hypothetical protein FNF31_05286 [Cafeteria roenbergensis]|uniref:alpha-1,2-Mannosidase n=1 Tax=Cafeteria roenbergensis TaxID=33653 RepID=A0A5A8D136_CAFRO|nr:hypothetical protein FNF31_05286 [Cafeteria roenbergensis]KAA0171859.1 hypothetical protein FNF28_00494 [Cafeteria roenbergensis]
MGVPPLPAPPADDATLLRQEAVRRAIRHAWAGYSRYARGSDDLKPVSRQGAEGLCKMGVTAVDSIDTLLLAELPREMADAREWVRRSLAFGTEAQEDINVFETMIRVVGGLLGAHELSRDGAYLAQAADLARRLVSLAFREPTGIPLGTVGLHSRKAYNPAWIHGASAVSEVATLQLELAYIARKTGQPDLEAKGLKVIKHLQRANMTDGLFPIYLSPKTGRFLAAPVTLGARGDSTYEYLLKLPLLFHPARSSAERKDVAWVQAMYDRSVRGILSRLLQYSSASGMPYIAEQAKPADALPKHQSPRLVHKMDHLVCFLPGMLALGASNRMGFDPAKNPPLADAQADEGADFFQGAASWPGQNGAFAKLLNISEGLASTCTSMYDTTTTGLAPEIVTFYRSGTEMRPNHDASHALLRPETVESLFVLWRVTHDEKYRDAAWKIFGAIERHARIWSGGYSSVKDVNWGGVLPTPSPDPPAPPDRPWPWHREEVAAQNRRWREECPLRDDSRCAWQAEAGSPDPPMADAVPPVFPPDQSGPRDTRNMSDHMESFFLAETLKYLYLIFSDDALLPLDEYVFNTEAHPFRML